MKKIIKTGIILFLLIVGISFLIYFRSVFFPRKNVQSNLFYEKINIQGETAYWGVYDPSVEYGENGIGYLTYSALLKQGYVDTHLAKSADNGKTWIKIAEVNSSVNDFAVYKNKIAKGAWRHETPTLVYDKDEPDKNKKWKLFWVKGFAKLPYRESDVIWDYVQVWYKYAATPEELPRAKGMPLFGSSFCEMPSCFTKYNLNNFHGDLEDVVFYMEPGSLAYNNVLYLTLSAVSVKDGQRTILLSSFDHGEVWKYEGILTDKNDIIIPDYPILTSSALAEENGKIFLLVSPRGKGSVGYNGVYAFEFEDISRGKLKRNKEGKLIVNKHIPPISSENIGGGQSEYDSKNSYGGIIMSQSASKNPSERFQIFFTKEKIIDNLEGGADKASSSVKF